MATFLNLKEYFNTKVLKYKSKLQFLYNINFLIMKNILDNDYAMVDFYEEEKLLQITWKKISGKLPLEEYQRPFNVGLDFQSENQDKIKYFITDIREQPVLSPDYRKWFQENAMQRAVDNGLTKAAAIFSGNVFQKYYINNILNTTKKFGLPLKVFSKREDAVKWLHG
jgi:hypothetical protein